MARAVVIDLSHYKEEHYPTIITLLDHLESGTKVTLVDKDIKERVITRKKEIAKLGIPFHDIRIIEEELFDLTDIDYQRIISLLPGDLLISTSPKIGGFNSTTARIYV